MMESGYYPDGAEYDDSAPYNQVEDSFEKVNVFVSITLSKSFVIRKYNDQTLEEAFCEHYTTPDNLAESIKRIFNMNLKTVKMPYALKSSLEDCSNWNIDEFEIIEE